MQEFAPHSKRPVAADESRSLTLRLTGVGVRSAEGANTSHESGDALVSIGVRVEPTVRLGFVAREE